MTEELKIAMVAINKWLFHGWNYKVVPITFTTPGGVSVTPYVPEFLKEIKWTCHISHMLDKWTKATRSQNLDAYMARFYAELDHDNRLLLMEWVMNNYNGEKKLF